MRQARYWIFTIKFEDWSVPAELPAGVTWITGQQELGEGGYHHWQMVVHFAKKVSLAGAKASFTDSAHCEPCRSEAANSYVQKEDTRVAESQFELGSKPINRASSKDWEQIWELAKKRKLQDIEPDIRIRCYNQFKRIGGDYIEPVGVERKVYCFWGASGTGKSRRAWAEAGFKAYPKSPTSKFWCGYRGQEHVVLDEFRGQIDVSHLLIWLDRYPFLIENKGGHDSMDATHIWITSNVDPREWYPTANEETKNAILRRMEITYFPPTIFE